MRLIFIATGDIALPSFRHLLENGPRPLALVTQPDKPTGRHQKLTPPAIKVEALAAGVPVYQPEKIGDITSDLAALRPEVIVVMAYGQILRKNILTLASEAIINLHASLLPKYRGAACIQAAIDAGDQETGITVMHVVRQLDAGDMIVKRSIPISPDETGGTLHDRLADLAPLAMAEALENLTTRDPQDESASTYISKLERDDGKIDWTQDATAIERRIRAYDPWPGTFTLAVEGGQSKRLKIFPPVSVSSEELAAGEISTAGGQLVVGCGKGAVRLETVQPDGGRRMSASDYLRGRKPTGFES
ncbi:methionyl-tRNA formyltransferase [Luteolibacter yonseiensis]|uniref:Methionyl-tRNA formyltransferase n=1 Tax=Luteolibacter yonseiensis TaxID=1144680 RepID=A0A934VCZ3_9BACT|nr:methionyl-tRNA formyltransferase [Luteolibacter yonseiensis]MBK1817640.1 methionyl-tRNA formyltransferase [Luteolibacter yonseiensis]